MRKQLKIGLAVVAILLVLAVAGGVYWFYTPGVHFLGPIGHIELTEDCYLYSPAGQQEGRAAVHISGNVRRYFFEGVITVEGVDSNGDTKGINQHGYGELDGQRRIIYMDNRVSFREDGTLYPDSDGYYFYVYLEQDGSFTVNVEYRQEQGENRTYCFTAIYAEDQDAADARYRQGKESGIIP